MKFKYGLPLFALSAATATQAAQTTQDTPAGAAPLPEQRPNILLILSDDQGYGDYSAFGQGQVETPCLDRLASESRYFTNFYAEPASAPCRASLLTGKSFIRTGVWSVHYGGDYIALDETLLPEVLHGAGYETALIGKWHSGKGPGYLPQYRGYDVAEPAVMHDHIDNDMTFNDVPIRLEEHPYWKKMTFHGWTLDKMAEETCEYLDRPHEQPFFLQLAFVSPHAPWHAPEELIEKYGAQGESRLFAAMNALVEHMDSTVGRILDHLDRTGLAQNTIVLFLSDNGYVHASPQGKLSAEEIARRNPLALRGTKGTVFEGGIWSPLSVRWPARIAPGRTEYLGHVYDLLPTLAQLAGVPAQGLPAGLDGESLCAALFDANAAEPERTIFGAGLGIPAEGVKYNPPLCAGRDRDAERERISYKAANLYARNARFKLVKFPGGRAELFDMTEDKQETTDVSERYPQQREALESALQRWFDGVTADPKTFRSPLFPIGPQPGGVLYFNGAARLEGDMAGRGPWAHSLAASRAGSGAVWRVTVTEPGRYAVYLQADASQPGAEVSFAAGDTAVRATLGKGKVHRLGVIDIASECHSARFTLIGDAAASVTNYWNIVLEPAK